MNPGTIIAKMSYKESFDSKIHGLWICNYLKKVYLKSPLDGQERYTFCCFYIFVLATTTSPPYIFGEDILTGIIS